MNTATLSALLPHSLYAADTARCTGCGGVLTRDDFRTNALGQTMECCRRCGPVLLQVRRNVEIVEGSVGIERPSEIASINRPSRDCIECHEPFFIRKGRETQEVCSPACRKVRRDRQHKESEQRRRAA